MNPYEILLNLRELYVFIHGEDGVLSVSGAKNIYVFIVSSKQGESCIKYDANTAKWKVFSIIGAQVHTWFEGDNVDFAISRFFLICGAAVEVDK